MSTRRGFLTAALVSAAASHGIDGFAAETQSGNDWVKSDPHQQGFDKDSLEQILEAGTVVQALRSLLVVRNGVLVGERYYGGAHADELQPINSVTKSISSLLVGKAVEQGKLKSDLSQTVGELLPELTARFPDSVARGVTLRQILTGTSGLAYDYRTQARALSLAFDPAVYALGLSGDGKDPGSWSYNDAAISLISPILQRTQGIGIAELAQRDLFAPLGIERYQWERDKVGRPYAFKGLKLRTRDLSKLAWTVSNQGTWQNVPVLSPAWIAESTRGYTARSWRVPPIGPSEYGFLWFTGKLYGHAVAWGWGYGAQFALVVPSLKLAVSTAATSPSPAELQAQNVAIMGLVARVVKLLV